MISPAMSDGASSDVRFVRYVPEFEKSD